MDDRFKVLKSAEDVSDLKGLAFEEYLRQLFEALGYRVVKTPSSGDYGGDLLVEKDGRRIAVQAKQYSSSVGFDAVKEAHFAKTFYDAHEAWVICTGSFTKQAKQAAEKTGVRLIEGNELTALIMEADCPLGARKEPAKGKRNRGPELFETEQQNERIILKQYHGSESAVSIPDFISVIGPHAFFVSPNPEINAQNGLTKPLCKSTSINSIQAEGKISTIGARAFQGLRNLVSFKANGIEKVDDYAFCSSGLACATIEPEIQYGEGVFAFSSVVVANIKPGCAVIPKGSFYHCVGLAEIAIPSTIKKIEEGAFSECTALTDVTIPEGVEEIHTGAFRNCTNLRYVALPSTLKVLAVDAFTGTLFTSEQLLPDIVDLTGVTIYRKDGFTLEETQSRGMYEREAFFFSRRTPAKRTTHVHSPYSSRNAMHTVSKYESAREAYQNCLNDRELAALYIKDLRSLAKQIAEQDRRLKTQIERLQAEMSETAALQKSKQEQLEHQLSSLSFFEIKTRQELRQRISSLNESARLEQAERKKAIVASKQDAVQARNRLGEEARGLAQKIDGVLMLNQAKAEAWGIPIAWIETDEVPPSESAITLKEQLELMQWFKITGSSFLEEESC